MQWSSFRVALVVYLLSPFSLLVVALILWGHPEIKVDQIWSEGDCPVRACDVSKSNSKLLYVLLYVQDEILKDPFTYAQCVGDILHLVRYFV